jgi:hypothetical protein
VRTQSDPPRGRRGLRAAAVAVAAVLGLVAVPATFAGAQATFSGTTGNTGDTLAADTLQPPAGLSATQSCAPAPAITRRQLSGGSGTASLTLTAPPGTTAGDVLIAHVAYRDVPEAISAPGGWTRLGEHTSGPVTSAIYWKPATTGEPTAVFTRPAGSTGPIGGGMVALVGASIDPPVLSGATGTSPTATTEAATTTGTTVEALYFFTKDQDQLPTPAGTTQVGAGLLGTAPTTEGLTGAEETVPGPGTLPVRSATSTSGLSSAWIAQTVVLRRGPGAPTATLTWTPSTSTWADGYQLARQVGGVTEATASVPGASSASTTSGPLVSGTTYTFRLRAYRGSWRSAAVTTTLPTSCP